jgi:hypothetical protein
VPSSCPPHLKNRTTRQLHCGYLPVSRANTTSTHMYLDIDDSTSCSPVLAIYRHPPLAAIFSRGPERLPLPITIERFPVGYLIFHYDPTQIYRQSQCQHATTVISRDDLPRNRWSAKLYICKPPIAPGPTKNSLRTATFSTCNMLQFISPANAILYSLSLNQGTEQLINKRSTKPASKSEPCKSITQPC